MKNLELRKKHIHYLQLLAQKKYFRAWDYRSNEKEFIMFDARYAKSRFRTLSKLTQIMRSYLLIISSLIEGLFPNDNGSLILNIPLSILVLVFGFILLLPFFMFFGLSMAFRHLTILWHMLKDKNRAGDRCMVGKLRFGDEN